MLIAVEKIGIEDRLSKDMREFGTLTLMNPADQDLCMAFVRVLELYLAFCKNVALVAPRYTTLENVEAAAVEIHLQLRGLLDSRIPMPESLRAELDRFAMLLPSEPASLLGYRFSRWVGFPHAGSWATALSGFEKRKVKALEVGSFEGRSACWLLSNVLLHPESELSCVDVFDEGYFQNFIFNVNRAGGSEKVKIFRGISLEILPTLAPSSFDLIYLDASSEASAQLTDCVLATRLLKSGGVLICDDYGGPPEWEPGVTRGIDCFMGSFGYQFDVIHSDFQIILQKK